MFLVVYGHAGDSYFTNELSWFRMPLFFFLSGILFKPIHANDFNNFLVYKAVKLLIPYLSYGLLIAIIFNFNNPMSIYSQMSRILIGGNQLQGPYGVFWFITVLLVTQVSMGYISRFKPIIQISVICIIYIIGHFITMTRLELVFVPWHLNAVTAALTYYYIGYKSRYFLTNYLSIRLFILIPAGLILNYIVILRLLNFPYSLNLKTNVFDHPVLDFIIPITCAYFICAISSLLCNIKFFSFMKIIGANSISIMYLHLPVNILIKRVISHDSSLLFILFGIAIPTLICLIFKKIKITNHLFISPPIKKYKTVKL